MNAVSIGGTDDSNWARLGKHQAGDPHLLGRKSVLLGMLTSGFVIANAAHSPAATAAGTVKPGAIAATTPTYLTKWASFQAYVRGQQVVSPNNDVVSANVAHTSGSTFNAANWSVSSTYVTQSPRSIRNPVTGFYDVIGYGGTGDGVEMTAAAQEAIDAVKTAGGGVVSFPPATSYYRVSGTLNCNDSHNLTLRGESGSSLGGNPGIYGYSSSAATITAAHSVGFTMKDLMVRKLASAYTGPLIDLSGTGGSGQDTAQWELNNVILATSSPTDLNGELVRINLVHDGVFHRVGFMYGAKAVVRNPTLPGYTGEANGIKFEACSFTGQGTTSIDSPGSSWSIDAACCFEPLYSGNLSAISMNAGTIVSPTQGLQIAGWFGDAAQTGCTGNWIQLRNARGVTIEAFIQIGSATGIRLDGSCNGVRVGGTLTGWTSESPAGTGLDFGAGGSGGHTAVDYAACGFEYLTTKHT
jgi:hypothetical protein